MIQRSNPPPVCAPADTWADVRRWPPARQLRWLESAAGHQHVPPKLRRQHVRSLRKLVRRVRVRSCSITIYEDIVEHGVAPLPHVPCACPRCQHGRDRTHWPAVYLRGAVSYECWLHAQSEWFLRNLPSSPGVVVGERVWRGGVRDPEADGD